jgi:hypothetical protein
VERAAPGAGGEARTLAAITLQRDSDPVWIQRPGMRGESALPFYAKRARVEPGSRVRTGAGGRAELLWSPDATSLLLFDACWVALGDADRGEPVVAFLDVARALVVLTPEDRVLLDGGALLSGDPLAITGPVRIERQRDRSQRVTNQSKRVATLVFRDERLELGPGEALDLPPLAGAPWDEEGRAAAELHAADGFAARVIGPAEREPAESGVRLRARGPTRVEALGVVVRLGASDSAWFSALPEVRPVAPADPPSLP